jgi:hypothetical protein
MLARFSVDTPSIPAQVGYFQLSGSTPAPGKPDAKLLVEFTWTHAVYVSHRSFFTQGVKVRLQKQPFRLLAILLEYAGEVDLRRRTFAVNFILTSAISL